MELGSPRAEGNRTSDATTSHIQMPSPWATSPGSAAGVSPAVFSVTVLSTVAGIILGSGHAFVPVSRAGDHI